MLGIHQGGATHLAVLWCYMWGRGQRGNSATCSALCWLSVTSSATHKQIRPFWCWFTGASVCVHSRTLWVSPMNSPVRLGVSLATSSPTDFFSQMFWSFLSPLWNPGLLSLSHSPILLRIYQLENVVQPALSAATLLSPPAILPSLVCQPPPCLEYSPPGCRFLPLLLVWMNVSSLTPWLLDSSIFWQFWFFVLFCFVFNLLLSLFWLCKEAKWIHLRLHLSQKFQLL